MAHLTSMSPAPTSSGVQIPLPTALQMLTEAIDALATATASAPAMPISDISTAFAVIHHAAAAVSDAAAMVTAAVSVNHATSVPVRSPAPIAASAFPSPPAAQSAPAFIRTSGPWIAGLLYGVVPPTPLSPVPDNGEKWFAITRGRYVGLTRNPAIATHAVTGISGGLSPKSTTQADALDQFNSALDIGAVNVVQ
ncbi:hypothetical protein DFH06DRAFT_1127025 [Mycena polygramma]|nr:hypothetical protein DFH06DRAFT_1127025 [Mycena polygramma]